MIQIKLTHSLHKQAVVQWVDCYLLSSSLLAPKTVNSRKRVVSDANSQDRVSKVAHTDFLHNTVMPETDTHVNSTAPRHNSDSSSSDVILIEDLPPVPNRRRQCDCSKDRKHPFSLSEALTTYASLDERQHAVELYKQSPSEIFHSLVHKTVELESLRTNATKLLRTVAPDLFSSESNSLLVDDLLQTVVSSLEES